MVSETAIAEAATTVVRLQTPRGASAETATVVRLYVAIGDLVEAGAAVCLLHTDCFLYALPATASGIVGQWYVATGAELRLDEPLLNIVASPPEPSPPQPQILPPAPRATPLARAIAGAHGLDLRTLAGASPGGRIRAADVRTALGEQSNGHVSAPAIVSTISAFEARRPDFIIHDHRPQAITAIEVTCDRDASEEQSTARIVYSTVQALIEHPRLNSRWTDDGVLLYGRINLGLWRDTVEGQSLMLLPNAADLSLRGIEHAIAHAARDPEEPGTATRATFTVSRTDAGWWSEALIPAGSAALLHIGAVALRVVVDPATEHLAIRLRRLLALTYDARHIAQFEADCLLMAVRTRVEQRRRL